MEKRKYHYEYAAYTDNLCYGEEQIGYIVKADGKDLTDASRAVIELDGTMNTQYVTLTVENPKAPEAVTLRRISSFSWNPFMLPVCSRALRTKS